MNVQPQVPILWVEELLPLLGVAPQGEGLPAPAAPAEDGVSAQTSPQDFSRSPASQMWSWVRARVTHPQVSSWG